MSDDPQEPQKRAGYCVPPEHSRFKPGNRANTFGRPKQDREDFAKAADAIRDRKVEVREGGRVRYVPTHHAVILNLDQNARRGDLDAIERLIEKLEKGLREGTGGSIVIEIVNALPKEALAGGDKS